MRVNRGLLGWGVFFIVLGAVPLAVRAGLLSEAALVNAWQLWPLLLVGAGLGLVLAQTRVAVVGGLVIAVTFGLIGGAAIAAGFRVPAGVGACAGDRSGTPFPESSGAFEGPATVAFEIDCDELEVGSAAGTSWQVSGTSPDGRGPDVLSTGGRLQVHTPNRGTFGLTARGAQWQVTLPRDVPMAIELSVNAGSADLGLGDMDVTSVSASINAGSALIDLSGTSSADDVSASVNAGALSVFLPAPASQLDVSASVNAGAMVLCLAPGTPLQVDVGGSPLGAHNLDDRGLVRDDDSWTTPGLDPDAPHVSLDLSVNLGSFTLDPEDGCG